MKKTIAALCLCALGSAHAAWSGNNLLKLKNEAGEEGARMISSYAQGVLDFETFAEAMTRTERHGDGHLNVCVRDGVTADQAGAVLVKYLEEHPDMSDAPAVLLAHSAFLKAWPCAKQAAQ
jgi:hypothetical protein